MQRKRFFPVVALYGKSRSRRGHTVGYGITGHRVNFSSRKKDSRKQSRN
jgi:hypothetical protein